MRLSLTPRVDSYFVDMLNKFGPRISWRIVRRIGRTAKATLIGMLDHTMPQQCALCAQPVPDAQRSVNGWSDNICHWCVDALPGLNRPRCPVCALPNARGTQCSECRASHPIFSATHVLADYAMPLDNTVHQLKYGAKLSLAQALAQPLCQRRLLGNAVNAIPLPAWPELIVAVPLSPTRLRERGYNQAALLAKQIGQRLNIPVCTDGLYRTGEVSETQTNKSRAERIHAMRNQFVAGGAVRKRRIALVDDVMTTGATVNAAASALITGGASTVRVIAIARTQ